MNIQIHNNPGALTQMVGAADATKTASAVESAKVLQGNDKGLTISEGLESVPVESIPDSALRRNDPLGKLVGAAFNLPPPPMPAELA